MEPERGEREENLEKLEGNLKGEKEGETLMKGQGT